MLPLMVRVAKEASGLSMEGQCHPVLARLTGGRSRRLIPELLDIEPSIDKHAAHPQIEGHAGAAIRRGLARAGEAENAGDVHDDESVAGILPQKTETHALFPAGKTPA